MKTRWPLIGAQTPQNRFGWQHEGPGPQADGVRDGADGLLPEERFAHPNLRRRPPYVPIDIGKECLRFSIAKGTAGLAGEYRSAPEDLSRRVMNQELRESDLPAIRWWISGLHRIEDFVRLHTSGRLTIEEMAYMVRRAFGDKAPYRGWLNQWGREPERELPSLAACIKLESSEELVGMRIDDIGRSDSRRIDENGITYVKLNGHIYWRRQAATNTTIGER